MKYKYHNKQVLRSPLKPIKTSFSRVELQQLFSEKDVQEALFLASPNLLIQYKKWVNKEITDKKEEEKLIFSLLKYALRMHSRCTPYGLFAGCNILTNLSDNVTLSREEIKRNTRLDMNYTCALIQELIKLKFVQPYLKFYPNTSIYKLKDKVRYVEYYYKNNRRIHQISSVDSSVYINTILQKAQYGATLNELAQTIIDSEISIEEAIAFLQEMVQAQLLVSELEPVVTKEEPLTRILNVLKNILKYNFNQELKNIYTVLKDVQKQLAIIDLQIGNDVIAYQNLSNSIKQLEVSFDLSKLFQTDMFISILSRNEDEKNDYQTSKNQINLAPDFQNIKKDLQKAITVLNQFTDRPVKTNLTEFQRKFYERYEDKEVAIMEVLDNETGIGYAQISNQTGDVNPLVNDLILPYNYSQETELKWNKKQSFLFKKFLEAYQNKQQVVQIKGNDLEEFKPNWEDLPESFSIMYQHLGQRQGQNLLLIDNVGGSSAINLLGRFASSNTEMEGLVNEIAEKEQKNNPDVVFAEIVHLPESRTGNILLRPAFRDYEIPYLAKSSLPQENQISLNDLYLSIKNNRFYLYSKRLKKQVIPRLGNAHNYSFNTLPVYRFLCDLQNQNQRSGLFFDWGVLKNEFTFLPRVEVENVIISSATWQLKKEHFQELTDKKGTILTLAKSWKDKWKIPDLVLLADGDNELLINLKDELSLKMFISEIKKRTIIILKEYLHDEKTAIVRDEHNNPYTNEFIAILQKEPLLQTNRNYGSEKAKSEGTPSPSPTRAVSDGKRAGVRNFSLGSEWLYYKIYCGVKTADTILTELIKPLTEKLIEEQLIDRWFFIRYADPDVHLRVRFHFTNLQHIGTVVHLFQEAIAEYEQNGLVWKVQTDTYKREMERYGTNTIFLSEQFFYYDSQCVVDMLDMIDGDEGEEIRWLIAIKAVDALLSDFNYSMEQKRDLLESLKTGFANEFNMNKDLKMQLDKKFRTYRDNITEILNPANDETSDLQPLFELLKQKSENIAPLVAKILTIQQYNQLQLHINDLLASYIHMLLNRLFKNKQRMHEMVIYDFMWRTYHSEIAKQKHLNKQVVI